MRVVDSVDAVLGATAAFYERFLWESEICAAVRARLARDGMDSGVLREFGIGYAPDRRFGLLEHLQAEGFTPEELVDSGVASASQRGNVHLRLRSRVTFPVRDADGRVRGFAGLATNPGPSWPEWLTTVEGERFRRKLVLFGLHQAREAIVAAEGALVARDPLEVLRQSQDGRRHIVSTVRSEFSNEHLNQLAIVLGRDPADLQVIGDERAGGGGLAVRLREPGGRRAPNRGLVSSGARHVGRMTPGRIRPDPIRNRTNREKIALNVLRVLTGIAIPLLWLAVFRPNADTPQGGTAFVAAVACVPVTYLLLTFLSSWVSARVRLRSGARRMRQPWESGSTEWQPPMWTYHRVEDVLIGAAPVSFLVCIGLFLVVFGFA